MVHLHPHFRTAVNFCEQQQPSQETHQPGQKQPEQKQQQQQQQIELQEEECAIGAQCATIYRKPANCVMFFLISFFPVGWADALVRHPHPRHLNAFVPDQVLVPVDCLCVLAYRERFGTDEPIVLE